MKKYITLLFLLCAAPLLAQLPTTLPGDLTVKGNLTVETVETVEEITDDVQFGILALGLKKVSAEDVRDYILQNVQLEWGNILGTLSNQIDLQNALNAKENAISAGTTSQYWRGDKSWQTLNKTAVGLGNVDNTSDANKPISNATQSALDDKYNASNPANYIAEGSDSEATVKYISVASAQGGEPDTVYFVPKLHQVVKAGQLTIFKAPGNTTNIPEAGDRVEGFMEDESENGWFVIGKYSGTGSFFLTTSYELLNGTTLWD